MNVNVSSDRLSPILVKELRQGIRSNLFTGAFLLIQTLLFFFGLSLVSSESMRQDPTIGTAIFWVMLSLPMLLLVPGTASQAVEKEVTGKTIELLLLTRLSAYRIVLGKWMSAVVQSALILSTVLPYMMLRYFLGGVDIWLELFAFGVLFLASALLAGISMGLWSVNVSRWAKVGGLLFLLWLVPWVLAILITPRGGLGGVAGAQTLLWVYGAIVMFMMMEAAAARIAPPAENHTSRTRALALAAVALAFPLSALNGGLATALALLVALPTLVVALNEPIRPVARLYEPFTRGPALRRLAAFPLCPGWPGGVVFGSVIALALPCLPELRNDMTPFLWLSLVATFAMPAALVHTFFSGVRRRIGLFVLILVVSSLPVYLFAFAEGLSMKPFAATLRMLAGLSPPLAAVLELETYGSFEEALVVRAVLLVVAGVSLTALVRRARREHHRMLERTRASEAAAPVERLALAG